MSLYYITERRQLLGDLQTVIGRAIRAGVELVQIREKDLSARELLELTRAAVVLARESPARILVNTRADIAVAAGAHGVHLPAGSVSPADIRAVLPPGLLVGVSCHNVEEVRRAASEGADLAVFGPVFETASKAAYGPPQGLGRLREACRATTIPIYALGGVSLANMGECFAAGAAGIAGISLFQQAEDMEAIAAAVRKAAAGERT